MRLDNCLTETKVGLDAERMEVGQRINCNRGDPNPIHDHSRLRVDCWGQRPGRRLNDWYSPGCWVAPWSNDCQRRGQDRHEHQYYRDVVYYEEIKRELSLKKTQVTVRYCTVGLQMSQKVLILWGYSKRTPHMGLLKADTTVRTTTWKVSHLKIMRDEVCECDG